MKKIISLLLSFVMALSMTMGIGISAFAQDNKCGENLVYTIDKDTLTISGKGEMEEFYDDTPWFDSSIVIFNVVIEEGVTSISNGAFYGMKNIMSVSLPSTLTSIGDNAFAYCETLDNITIPPNVKYIGKKAFNHCGMLEKVNIPNGITSIKSYTFNYCSSLENVNIPATVTSIDSYAFYSCSALTNVNVPLSVNSIGEAAFSNCKNLKTVTLNNGLLSIGDDAFYNSTKLVNITVPSTVKAIGSGAFGYTAIKKVDIPNGVKKINAYTFQGCKSLSTVSISKNCKSVDSSAFMGYYDKNGTYIPTPITSLTVAGKKTTLKNTKIKSMSTSKSGKTRNIKVNYNTVKGISGYEVEYSRDKKYLGFKTSKASAKSITITKRHAKSKYYVRIRTYKDVSVGNKKIRVYSKWSSYSTIKTK